MYSNNRDLYRKTFFNVWEKYKKKMPLETIESQILEIILLHPEYHSLFEKPDAYQDQEFTIEENPFLHLSLHLAIRDQLQTNRPFGIVEIYQTLLKKYNEPHEIEHQMLTCLAQMMWQAQQNGVAPNEEEYLVRLRSHSE